MSETEKNNTCSASGTTNGEPDVRTIHRVAIKPAEFSEATASAWFAILEAQFALANITVKQTKFYHALSALPATTVQRLPPSVITGADYDELKESVLTLVERSKPELFESLLSNDIMAGKPSSCMSALLRTAQKVGVGDDFVRHRFLQNMPSNVTPVLAAQPTMELAQLGALADEIMALTTGNNSNRGSIAAVGQHQTALRRENQQINHHYSVRPFKPNQIARICRSHIYFGNRARTCRNWCEWPNKSNVNVGPDSRPSSPVRGNQSPPPRQQHLNYQRRK